MHFDRPYVENMKKKQTVKFQKKESQAISALDGDNVSYSQFYEAVSVFNDQDHLKDGRGKDKSKGQLSVKYDDYLVIGSDPFNEGSMGMNKFESR